MWEKRNFVIVACTRFGLVHYACTLSYGHTLAVHDLAYTWPDTIWHGLDSCMCADLSSQSCYFGETRDRLKLKFEDFIEDFLQDCRLNGLSSKDAVPVVYMIHSHIVCPFARRMFPTIVSWWRNSRARFYFHNYDLNKLIYLHQPNDEVSSFHDLELQYNVTSFRTNGFF